MAIVFDYRRINEHLPSPYPFAPYRPKRPCLGTANIALCWCYQAGPNGTHLPCPPRDPEPETVVVDPPARL